MANPTFVSGYKPVAFFDRPNTGQTEKQVAEPFPCLGSGIGSQPSAAFMLDMVQTTLNRGMAPDGMDCLEEGPFPIYCKHKGIQPFLPEIRKPSEDNMESFFRDIGRGKDYLIRSVHNSHQATVLMKISAIQNQILERTKISVLGWRLFQPVVFDPLNLGRAVARKIRKLSDRITFCNPELKPMLFPKSFGIEPLPDKCLPTGFASKALFLIGALTKSLCIRIPAVRA